MSTRLILTAMIASQVFGQVPPPSPKQKAKQPAIGYVENGSGVVGVNPAQPYRPIPVRVGAPRESIFEFYLRALNPRQSNWGTEIDRRLVALREQSVSNPYFRLAAFQLALIIFLLVLCWTWWDKTRQIKWVAAECLTDAMNARTLAEARAIEAVERHNRHIDSCNRVIEGQASGIGGPSEGSNAALTIRELQTELAASRANCARLQHELDQAKAEHAQVDGRLAALEAELLRRSASPDAELVARLQRAESELAGRKGKRPAS